jgi:hypothetical protein
MSKLKLVDSSKYKMSTYFETETPKVELVRGFRRHLLGPEFELPWGEFQV